MQDNHANHPKSQAGLNLNLFGALSGALSSKSKKTTHQNKDGSSDSVEDRHDQGKMFISLGSHVYTVFRRIEAIIAQILTQA